MASNTLNESIGAILSGGFICDPWQNKLGKWSDIYLARLLGGRLDFHHWDAGNYAVLTIPGIDHLYSTYWDGGRTGVENELSLVVELWRELCPPLSTGRQWTGYLLDELYNRGIRYDMSGTTVPSTEIAKSAIDYLQREALRVKEQEGNVG